MSKNKSVIKRRPRRKTGQIALYVLSVVLILSMAIGYILIAAPPNQSGDGTPSPVPTVVAPAPGVSGVPVAPTPTPRPASAEARRRERA